VNRFHEHLRREILGVGTVSDSELDVLVNRRNLRLVSPHEMFGFSPIAGRLGPPNLFRRFSPR
jgi:hypothetical protein